MGCNTTCQCTSPLQVSGPSYSAQIASIFPLLWESDNIYSVARHQTDLVSDSLGKSWIVPECLGKCRRVLESIGKFGKSLTVTTSSPYRTRWRQPQSWISSQILLSRCAPELPKKNELLAVLHPSFCPTFQTILGTFQDWSIYFYLKKKCISSQFSVTLSGIFQCKIYSIFFFLL